MSEEHRPKARCSRDADDDDDQPKKDVAQSSSVAHCSTRYKLPILPGSPNYLPSRSYYYLPAKPCKFPKGYVDAQPETSVSQWVVSMKTKLQSKEFYLDQKKRYHMCGACVGIYAGIDGLDEHAQDHHGLEIVSEEQREEFSSWEEEEIIAQREAKEFAKNQIVKQGIENLTPAELEFVNKYANAEAPTPKKKRFE